MLSALMLVLSGGFDRSLLVRLSGSELPEEIKSALYSERARMTAMEQEGCASERN